MIVKSEKTLQLFRGLKWCAWCGRQAQCQACHVFARGHGGGTRLDIALNLFSGCPDCHAAQHAGRRPILCDRLTIVAAREGMLQDQVERQLRRIMSAPKECRLCLTCNGSGANPLVFRGERLEVACISCNGGGILAQHGGPYEE